LRQRRVLLDPSSARSRRTSAVGSVVTDVASTKRDILKAACDAGLSHSFVGSHPLAGTHASGWDAGRANMFEGAVVFVCPAESDKAVPVVTQLWTTVGANVQLISAEDHDRRIAWLSHLPQLLATGLALTLKDAGVNRSDLGTGGRDMTRLAGSDPEMWLDIVASNVDMLDERCRN
jgi:prephenate dehydrogenase